MDDQTLAQKQADLDEKMQLIVELTDEARELQREITDELLRRNERQGTVHEFRPRPSDGGPTDQGTC